MTTDACLRVVYWSAKWHEIVNSLTKIKYYTQHPKLIYIFQQFLNTVENIYLDFFCHRTICFKNKSPNKKNKHMNMSYLKCLLFISMTKALRLKSKWRKAEKRVEEKTWIPNKIAHWMERYQVAYGNVRQDKLTQILTIKYAPLLQWREKKLCHITLGA